MMKLFLHPSDTSLHYLAGSLNVSVHFVFVGLNVLGEL